MVTSIITKQTYLTCSSWRSKLVLGTQAATLRARSTHGLYGMIQGEVLRILVGLVVELQGLARDLHLDCVHVSGRVRGQNPDGEVQELGS